MGSRVSRQRTIAVDEFLKYRASFKANAWEVLFIEREPSGCNCDTACGSPSFHDRFYGYEGMITEWNDTQFRKCLSTAPLASDDESPGGPPGHAMWGFIKPSGKSGVVNCRSGKMVYQAKMPVDHAAWNAWLSLKQSLNKN